MINEELHDINLIPVSVDNYELALKSFVLFCEYQDKTIIAVSKNICMFLLIIYLKIILHLMLSF